ncbi:MAG: BlaI/MecI/CopY family transcriptional regulator [Planctomycetaceae bacterium]|jgi:predicted transcriptional regulator|nr:BlaI/MecI/CopY family transcriptional regulator [Planctomycetaceae bacterium]
MKKNLLDLGIRERQIVGVIYRLGEASVADVLAGLPEPPSYSAVRSMLGLLVQKNVLACRHEGKRYLYQAVMPKETAQRQTLQNILTNLFSGSASDVVVALLDVAGEHLREEDFVRIQTLIDNARKENR